MQGLLHPKKVDTLPLEDDNAKRTNEIKVAIPLLDTINSEIFKTARCIMSTASNPIFVVSDPPDGGRIEIHKIWASTELNS